MGAGVRGATDAVLAFVACVNRGDVEGLGALMTDEHTLAVFDEAPLVGRDANMIAWRGYAQAFPAYTIQVHEVAAREGRVAILGHTSGSHLGLPADEERAQTLVWLADVVNGRLSSWRLVEDTPARRAEWGFRAAV